MEDINILDIDQKIKNLFNENKDKINTYVESLNEIKIILNKSNIENIIGKDKKLILEKKAKELTSTIKDLLENKTYGYYILQSFHILDKYKEEIKKPIEIFLFKKNTDEKINACKDIVTTYLDIASEFQDIFKLMDQPKVEKKTKRIRKSKNKSKNKRKKILKCKNCRSKDLKILGEGGYICNECFIQVDPVSMKIASDKINITLNNYQELDNFINFMKQYQGKQDVKINEDLYEYIKETLKNMKLLTNPTENLEKYKKVTKKHIYNILSKSKWAKYHKHYIYIWVQLTGKSAEDLSDIETQLENDYKTYINIYNIKKTRTNAPHTQCLFYQLLIKHGRKVDKSDFNFLKDDRLEQYNQSSKEIFDILNWNYVSIY